MRHILFALFFLCIAWKVEASEPPHVKEGIRLLTNEVELLALKGIGVFGAGGSFLENINSLEMYLDIPLSLEIRYARAVFLTLFHQWVDHVNDDDQAMPYLKNYPLESDNFDLRIVFKDYENPSSPQDPKVALVFNLGNKIVYCHRNHETNLLEPFHRESMEEGVLTVMKDNQIGH